MVNELKIRLLAKFIQLSSGYKEYHANEELWFNWLQIPQYPSVEAYYLEEKRQAYIPNRDGYCVICHKKVLFGASHIQAGCQACYDKPAVTKLTSAELTDKDSLRLVQAMLNGEERKLLWQLLI